MFQCFSVDWINNVYALIICARIEIDAKKKMNSKLTLWPLILNSLFIKIIVWKQHVITKRKTL